MKEDKIFGVSDVTFENLKSLSDSSGAEFEERVCEIALLADRIADGILALSGDELDLPDALTALKEESELFIPPESDCDASLNGRRIASYCNALCDFDKLVFSELLAEKLVNKGYAIAESSFLPQHDGGERITYVRSTLTDEAYDVFSQDFSEPRIVYAAGSREALRSVADGDADYCIIPFEEKGGARVFGVYSMIAAMDLKIVGVTPVFGPEGNADVRYALVSTGFRELDIVEGDDLYFELLIPSGASLSVGALLASAERLGYSPYRIASVEYDNDGERASAVSVSLRNDGNDFSPLLIFLELFSDDYTPIGFYKNIE